MADSLNDLFTDINKIDPFGPYRRREMKVEVVNGEKLITQITHIESAIGGVMHVIDEVKYLCQDCQVAWLTPGINAFMRDNKILCDQCLKKAKIKSFLKLFWGPFIKFNRNK